ncbi:uncharacterized protein METZ01_LOCUS416371, partial [marine metagenome]
MLKKIGIGLGVLIILALIFGEGEESGNSSGSANAKVNYMNQWVQSSYFKVRVIGVSETTRALDEYMCDPAPSGSKYVVINIAIENTDTESRTLIESGELHIEYDGKTIKYDTTESCTLLVDGYISFMDDIGPFVKIEGRVAFVVPQRFAASDMFYQVPRGYEKIALKSAPPA